MKCCPQRCQSELQSSRNRYWGWEVNMSARLRSSQQELCRENKSSLTASLGCTRTFCFLLQDCSLCTASGSSSQICYFPRYIEVAGGGDIRPVGQRCYIYIIQGRPAITLSCCEGGKKEKEFKQDIFSPQEFLLFLCYWCHAIAS